jgi:hypothetical protein
VPVGLPARIALPILAAFAIVFLGVMAYLLKIGFGTTGAAFGPGVTVAQQGDADLRATPAPIATPGPGTFTVPQTGTGPIAASGATLPGQQTGGGTPAGPPAPVMAAVSELRARIALHPKDVAALEVLGNLELSAQHFEEADRLYARALALDPHNFDVRLHDADALHGSRHDRAALAQIDRVLRERPDFPDALYDRGVVLHALGRTAQARASFARYLTVAGPGDAHAADARAALSSLGK